MQYIPWLIAVCAVIVAAVLAVKLNKTRADINVLCDCLQNSGAVNLPKADKNVKRLANELNKRLNEIEKIKRNCETAETELKETVTNISHDLRTPLTAINGYFALLGREEKSETVARYLSQIENRVNAITLLTEELFRYSVISSVRASVPKRVNICSALEESLVSFFGAFESRGIVPTVKIPDIPVWKICDEDALSRVFGNIIGNAVKYSEKDFSVTMTADCEITFENSAKSLEAVDVSRLFERFYTVDAKNNSTGLGLAIAKTLVNQMGGDIYADYKNGKLIIHLNFCQ